MARVKARGIVYQVVAKQHTGSYLDQLVVQRQAQVARSMAALVSIIGEGITPKQLLEIINKSLNKSPRVFGTSFSFEPDSYPWINGSLTPSHPSLSEGVPSKSGDYNWSGATQPNTLVPQELWPDWPGETRVLYGPYITRAGVLMDFGDSGNYFTPDIEWYHAARTKFINEELDFVEGVWGRPYVPQLNGTICLMTYSVPFWRQSPVPVVPVPDIDVSQYGLPENRGRQDIDMVPRYFWGIAAMDIDILGFDLTCDPGSFFNNETLQCERCPVGKLLNNNGCVPCFEYEYSDDNRSECRPNGVWMFHGFACHLWLAIVILSAGQKLQRRFYVYIVKHDSETGGFLVQLCNKHGIHILGSSRKLNYPRIYLYGTGHEVLDRPRDSIHFKVYSEDQLQLLWMPAAHDMSAPKSPTSSPASTLKEPWNGRDKAQVMNLTESSKVSGYVRFGLAWELLDITMCRVPIVMWLAPSFCFAVGAWVLWRIEAHNNGHDGLLVILSTAFAIVFWVLVAIGARCLWHRSATLKQRHRHQLLNERGLIGMLEHSCWEKDIDKQHEVHGGQTGLSRERYAVSKDIVKKSDEAHEPECWHVCS